MFQIKPYAQPKSNNQNEEKNPPEQAGLTKGQGDKYRHECSKCRNADDVSQNNHEKTAYRYEQQDPVDSLGPYGEAEQRKAYQERMRNPATFNGSGCRRLLIGAHSKPYLKPVAAF